MEREDRDFLLIYHLESWREGVWPEWVTRVTSGPSESQVSPPPGSGGLSDLGVQDVGPGGRWKHVLEHGSRTKQAAPSADGAHTRTAQPRPHLEPSSSAALSVCLSLSLQAEATPICSSEITFASSLSVPLLLLLLESSRCRNAGRPRSPRDVSLNFPSPPNAGQQGSLACTALCRAPTGLHAACSQRGSQGQLSCPPAAGAQRKAGGHGH